MRRLRGLALVLASGLAALLGPASLAHADGAPRAARTGIAAYYAELQRMGIIDPKTGTQDTLKGDLAIAEAALERGDLGTATAMLYGIVESPRYTDFDGTVEYQNAEYDLVVALAGAGAYTEALDYAERVIARGPKAPYFAVAHRRAVDIALETRTYAETLARLEAIKFGNNKPGANVTPDTLPVETASERTYLSGRAAYEAGKLDDAEQQLAQVSRKDRLFSSAVYLRGVIRVRQGKLTEATEAFCEIVGTGDDDKYTFFIDDRYYGLKDLARLGAGRIAHEEKRFDDAYYHYFQIPDDSDRLPEALFEAAWSMYQKQEMRTARELIKQFQKNFVTSPLMPEAMLLAGYIELADCKFEEADKKFTAVLSDLKPLLDTVGNAQQTGSLRQFMMARALERVTPRGPNAAAPPLTDKPEDRILAMLRLDPRLVRMNEAIAGLRREAKASSFAIDAWRRLIIRITEGKEEVTKVATPVNEDARRAAELLADIRRLREENRRERGAILTALREQRITSENAAMRLPDLDTADTQLGALEEKAHALSGAADKKLAQNGDPVLRGMLSIDLESTEELALHTKILSDSFDKTSDDMALKELERVKKDLSRILERARLGKVDSVIGEKRKLEKDIEDIAKGDYVPPELAKAYRQGLISDTEEYWPPEEEIWNDEFEGWK